MKCYEITYCEQNDALLLKVEYIRLFYSKESDVVTIVDDANHKWSSATREEAIAAARAILKHFNAGLEE